MGNLITHPAAVLGLWQAMAAAIGGPDTGLAEDAAYGGLLGLESTAEGTAGEAGSGGTTAVIGRLHDTDVAKGLGGA